MVSIFPSKTSLGIGVEADLGARPHLHAREILLEQAAEEVDVLQIADDGDDVLGVDGLALDRVAAEDEAGERRADGDARAAAAAASSRALPERGERLPRGGGLGVERRRLRRGGGDLLAGRQRLGLEVLEPVGVEPRRPSGARSRGRERRAGARQLRRFEHGDRLPRLHAIAFLRLHVDDAARDAGREAGPSDRDRRRSRR